MPDLWPDVLTDVARGVGARGGLLFNLGGQRMVGTAEVLAMGDDFVAAGYMALNHRPALMLQRRDPGFATDMELCTPEERRTHPMFTEFLRPRGYHVAAGTAILGAGFEDLLLTFEGFPDDATTLQGRPVLDALRPHFARAATLSAQLRLEQARAAVAALRLISVPAAMLTARGRLMAANDLFQAGLGEEMFDRASGLQLRDVRANAALRSALERTAAGLFEGLSIALPATPASGPRVLHVLPVTGRSRDIFTSAAVLLVLTTTEAPPPPGANLIQALFDLTPAEARVAQSLAAGDTVKEIAAQSGKSEHTVRVHVRSLLAKTGLNRQAELVRMLIGLSGPPTSPLG